MLKKTIAATLVLLMLFGLSACGNSPAVGVDSSSLEPLVIGGIGYFSDAPDSVGQSVYRGAQTAVEEINATGGVNGFRLVLNFQDSKDDSRTALSVYGKLLDNGMKVLIAGGFEETEDLIPLTARDGILTLTPTLTGAEALGAGGNVFRVCFSDVRLGTETSNFLADQASVGRVTVLFSDAGAEQAQAFLAAYSGKGVAESLSIPSGPAADYTEVVDHLSQTPPEMLYLAMSEAETLGFLQAYGWNGTSSPVKILGNVGVESLPGLLASPAAAEGLYTLTPFSADETTALVQNFVASYEEKYEALPDRYAAEGYDAVYAVAEALKKAGITPDTVGDDFGKKMISAMTRITVNGVTGAMSWTADGETTRIASFKVLRNGRQVPFFKEENASF